MSQLEKYQTLDNEYLHFQTSKSLVECLEILAQINKTKKILEYQKLKKENLLDTRFIRYNIKINDLGRHFHINQRAKWKADDLDKNVLSKLDFKLRRQ